MIRILYPYPDGPVDFALLAGELRSADSTVIDTNDVGGLVAVYTPEAQDETAFGAIVAAHTGPVPEPPDPLYLLAQAIVDASSLEDLKPVAQQILSDESS